MIKSLIKIANSLDKKGLTKEADKLDLIIKKIASRGEWPYNEEESDDMYSLNSEMNAEINPDEISNEDYEANLSYDEDNFTYTPETTIISRMAAVDELLSMTDQDFDDLFKKFPDEMVRLFGRDSMFPSSKVLKRLQENNNP